MIKDKDLKEEILAELLSKLDANVMKNDLDPIKEKKTKLVVKAEGDSPEQVKEEVVKKLSSLKLPDEEEMEDMEEGEDDFLSELPESIRDALLKKKLIK